MKNHFLALCGLCLGVLFLVQLQQGLVLGSMLVVLVGVLGLISRLRIGPFLLLVFTGGLQMFLQGQMGQPSGSDRGFTLQVNELLLSAAILGYVVGHYRLQTIWHSLWPDDPRQKAGPPRRSFPWLRRRQPVLQEKRPSAQITPVELVWLVMSLPVWAVIGVSAWGLLSRQWDLVGLPPILVRILFVVLFFAIVFFVARLAYDTWRHRHRDHEAARLFLQDVLWKETRGEQRRLNRWLAWRKKSG